MISITFYFYSEKKCKNLIFLINLIFFAAFFTPNELLHIATREHVPERNFGRMRAKLPVAIEK